jgi:hypothetical protein
MSKLISAALVAIAILLTSSQYPEVTFAGTCASKCGPRPLQFTPGQRIRLEVLNATSSLIKLEKIRRTGAIPLRPGEEFQLEQEDGTEPNISLVFWDETGFPLQATVSKPDFGTLRLELRRSARNPGDRSVQVLDDGRVNVF